MSVSPELMYAILAMGSYNRSYNPGIADLGGENNKICNATVQKDATQLLDAGVAETAGFYAVAYEWNGETIISYRGTDENIVSPWSDSGSDLLSGYGTGVGSPMNEQARLVAE